MEQASLGGVPFEISYSVLRFPDALLAMGGGSAFPSCSFQLLLEVGGFAAAPSAATAG